MASTETTGDAAPVEGGTLRAVDSADMRGFDVQRFYDTQSVTMADLVFSRLVRANPSDASEMLPDLAAEVPEPENDGRTWTFTLRNDAVFHDGTPVTSEDVKFSIERLIDARTKSEGGAYYTGWIEDTADLAAGEGGTSDGIIAVDEHTIRFELTEPRAAFLQLMGLWFASIYPKEYFREVGGETFNREPIGSGPFAVESYQPGRSATFTRNEQYYSLEEIKLDQIELSLAVAADTAMLQVDGGQADLLVSEVPAASYQQIKNDPQRAELMVEGSVDNTHYVTLNAVEETALFETPELREAIHQGINKDRILQQMQGRGEVATSYWSPDSAYYDPEFPVTEYDPEAAAATIEAAGLTGTEVNVNVPAEGSFFPLDLWGPSLVQDLEEIGLSPNLKSLEFSAWLNETMEAGAMVPNGWSMDVPHGSFVVDSAFTLATKEAADADGTCCNFSRWGSERVDELNTIGVTTTDKAEEVEAYQEIMRIAIAEEGLWIPLIWPTRAYYRASNVGGVEVYPNSGGMLLSRLWLES